MEDATAHGWLREVERHRCTVLRLEQLLRDLGSPLEEEFLQGERGSGDER
jgi:hypothetical protein